MKARVNHGARTVDRGNGYRKYEILYFCTVCKMMMPVIYVLGWGNVLRCEQCCIKVGKRCNLSAGTSFGYYRANKLIKYDTE